MKQELAFIKKSKLDFTKYGHILNSASAGSKVGGSYLL